MDIAVLVVAGAAIGTISSMIGVGGGILMVPLLSFFFVATTQEAVGTSLAAVVVTSLFSSLRYGRQGVIDYALAGWMAPSVIAGAWLGAWLTTQISSDGLALAFGLLLMYPALMMVSGREPKEIAQWFRLPNQDRGPVKVVAIGAVAGIASGFFGVGSGILMVPAMAVFLGVDMLHAVATSLLVMGPSALVASVQHFFLNNLHFELMLPLAAGIVVGAQLGPRLAMAMPRRRLRQAFGIVLAYAGANMVWKGVAALL